MITAERLRDVLDYDLETGVFRWRQRLNSRTRIGEVAGSVHHVGYIRITIDGTEYLAHRLAWLYVYATWPHILIDHRNGVKTDNRIANLREATTQQNAQNQRLPTRINKSGFLGVIRNQGKWRADIKVFGRSRTIGHFDTPEEAHAAYLAAKRTLHPFWDPEAA